MCGYPGSLMPRLETRLTCVAVLWLGFGKLPQNGQVMNCGHAGNSIAGKHLRFSHPGSTRSRLVGTCSDPGSRSRKDSKSSQKSSLSALTVSRNKSPTWQTTVSIDETRPAVNLNMIEFIENVRQPRAHVRPLQFLGRIHLRHERTRQRDIARGTELLDGDTAGRLGDVPVRV